ncbi:hypothetical protein LXL04_024517 [Taraxacum kok-saghyz]
MKKTKIPLFFSLTGNTQTSRLEEAYASFGGKLQEKCICPTCHCDNVELLGLKVIIGLTGLFYRPPILAEMIRPEGFICNRLQDAEVVCLSYNF